MINFFLSYLSSKSNNIIDYIENVADCATIKNMKTGDEYKMLYHYEYAIWTIEKKTLRIAVGVFDEPK